MHKGLHPQVDADCLLPRNCGDHNLKSVKDSIQLEEQLLTHYVRKHSNLEPVIITFQLFRAYYSSCHHLSQKFVM